MKCKNCGATVLKGDQTCKKCGATLIEAAEVYSADQQYRSRFTLFFLAWIGAFNGVHLKWLGYTEQAALIKEKYGIGITRIFNPWWWISSMGYQCIECTCVIFGKYRKDADGHPIRYFKPNKNK